MEQLPSQCPECDGISVIVTTVPPHEHDRGDDWMKRLTCDECDDFERWV